MSNHLFFFLQKCLLKGLFESVQFVLSERIREELTKNEAEKPPGAMYPAEQEFYFMLENKMM